MNLAMVVHSATLPVRGAEGTDVPTYTTTLKSAEMLVRATTRNSTDSDAVACPTTTNNQKWTNPTTNAGQDSPKMSTRPMMANAAKIPTRPGASADTSTWSMPPATRASSLA